jgi:putative ABC transport system permease protein
VKIKPSNTSRTINFIKNTLKKYGSGRLLEYFFIDEDINNMYRAESQFMNIFKYFTFISIFIAALGLFGLASIVIEHRTKEMGIRKVLGASISSLILLLSRDFLKLIILANVFAWPAAFYFINKWLHNFAYRVNLSIWLFLVSAFITLIIALLSIIFQSLKASNANPADTLKYE